MKVGTNDLKLLTLILSHIVGMYLRKQEKESHKLIEAHRFTHLNYRYVDIIILK